MPPTDAPVDAARSARMLDAVTTSVRRSRSSASTSAAGPAAEVLAALVALRALRASLDDWEPELIAAARSTGASWAELAPVLGVASRQAAERRYLRLRQPRPGEAGLTGDERVAA